MDHTLSSTDVEAMKRLAILLTSGSSSHYATSHSL